MFSTSSTKKTRNHTMEVVKFTAEKKKNPSWISSVPIIPLITGAENEFTG